MTHGLAPEGADTLAHLPAAIEPPSLVRDRSFKLAEIGFLRLLPTARMLRAASAFLAVGFDPHLVERLTGLYGRHDIAGTSCPGGDIDGLDGALAASTRRSTGRRGVSIAFRSRLPRPPSPSWRASRTAPIDQA